MSYINCATLTSRISKRKFLLAVAGGIAAVGMGYLTKEIMITQTPPTNFVSNITETTRTETRSTLQTKTSSTSQTKAGGLPPGQREIDAIKRWNIDHMGIVPINPKFEPDKWLLTVDGEVENKSTYNWQQFQEIPTVISINDFHCVEGWSVKNCKWQGVEFKTLAEIVKPTQEAKYVFIDCADGYSTSLDLTDLLKDNILLATKLNDKPLEESLGAPMRLVVPDKYGYKSAMWINRITFKNKKELGFWEKNGYSYTADVWTNDRFQ
jgi:DMSO/TMAO reductase YedYZ molybdopterin-dependent catalytic subunit